MNQDINLLRGGRDYRMGGSQRHRR